MDTPAPPPTPSLRLTHRPGFWATIALLAFSLPVVALGVLRSRPEPLPHYGALPTFRFTRQDGTPLGLEQLRGRPWVANFIFTRCPTVCPVFTQKMARVQERTAGFGDRLQLVSFSVDPTYDTPERLAAYAQKHRADPSRWSFLTGDYERLKDTVVQGFKVSMGRESMDEADVMGIFHGTHFVLVDGAGDIRGYYNSDDKDALERLLRDAERLALGAP